MSTAISVDLAYRSAADLGIVVLCTKDRTPTLDVFRPAGFDRGRLDPGDLAQYLVELTEIVGANVLLLDGPQGWRSEISEHPHSRACERALNTPAKTGLPGHVKPAPYLAFVEFSIRVFDGLSARGWPRLTSEADLLEGARVTIESFPLASWRHLRLPPLPAKARTQALHLDRARAGVSHYLGLPVPTDMTHDEIQAAAAALAFAPSRPEARLGRILSGRPPIQEHGTWREGYILTPAAA